jgi:hypothetical protein
MRFMRALTLLAFVPVLAMTAAVWAQAPAGPRLASVFPLGLQRGVATEVTVKTSKGPGPTDVRALLFSSPGLSARLGPAAGLTITATADAQAGDHDVWALAPAGATTRLTTPRRVAVDDLPEVLEKGYNETPQSCPTVPVPCIVNGAINPATDRDCYRIDLAAGQHVSIRCRSASLGGGVLPALTVYGPDSQELLHDDGSSTEPSLHFAAATKGRYAVRIEDRAYRPEPPGLYRLELTTGPRLVAVFPSVLTRGKTQTVTLYGFQLPEGEPVSPIAATPVASAPGAVAPASPVASAPGGPLQQLRVAITAPAAGDPDGGGWTPVSAALLESFSYRHPGLHGGVRFGLTDRAVVPETDKPHQNFAAAQLLTLPCEVAGRFLQPQEADWYRFTAKAGQPLWIEAVGERAGLVMDLEVVILNTQRTPLATLGATAHPKELPVLCPQSTLDPMGSWTAPENGTYYLMVRDLYGTAGVERGYRLAIEPRREDVRVIALPVPAASGGLNIAAGAEGSLQLVAIRRGGHRKPIRVRAVGLPTGLTAREVLLAPNQQTATWTVKATNDAPAWLGALALEAETEVDGKARRSPVTAATVVREGKVPAARLCAAIAAAVVR